MRGQIESGAHKAALILSMGLAMVALSLPIFLASSCAKGSTTTTYPVSSETTVASTSATVTSIVTTSPSTTATAEGLTSTVWITGPAVQTSPPTPREVVLKGGWGSAPGQSASAKALPLKAPRPWRCPPTGIRWRSPIGPTLASRSSGAGKTLALACLRSSRSVT